MQIEQPNKIYVSDHSIVYSCQYHIVFCPKYRRKVLIDGVDVRLKELVLDKQDEYGYQVIAQEVLPDHVHLLLALDPRVAPVDVVGKIKGYLSHELREQFPWLKSRIPSLWTRSKFISTVGSVSLEVVKLYIENQKNV
ncbi:MAG: IS200/IS605 family transposase [Chloroflexi bacterium]|nr:IS200/IS605 family transposase [Chloroflexota bacterium]